MSSSKDEVRSYWETEVCGTRFGHSEERLAYFDEVTKARYDVEPFIPEFAEFNKYEGKSVLEIGVGAGTDFENWIKNGAIATGVDLTDAAIELVSERLSLKGYDQSKYSLKVDDAEGLSFEDDNFDLVYSYGVLHHSPNTEKCLKEVFRVLKPGGQAKIMVYSDFSMTGIMLWARHALLKGRFWRTQKDVIFDHLESPGTKTYSPAEFKKILESCGFGDVQCSKELGTGDLLNMPPSRKYQHPVYRLIWRAYPRWLIQKIGGPLGLVLLCSARKPLET